MSFLCSPRSLAIAKHRSRPSKNLVTAGYSFLFESTEKNDVSGRFSFVGFEPRVIIQSFGRDIRLVRDGIEERFSTISDPLDELRKLMARHQFVSRPELPRFAGGAVGFIGYEVIRLFESKVPRRTQGRPAITRYALHAYR